MNPAAVASLDTDRPSKSVTVVRLNEPPAVDAREAVLDSLNHHAERRELLVLRGPGGSPTRTRDP